jgi:tetratricopeptide (TPR) repeat protein
MGNPEVRQTVIGDHNIFTATGDIRINYHLPPAEAEEHRVLVHLAESVKRFWIEGVLERSLHEVATLELGKQPLSDAVEHPWERILELPEHAPVAMAGEKKIGEIFSETGHALLILGEPGAGKTVTLLELARELIWRFETDPTQAVPVVLNLSTWHDKRRSLASWIESELKNKYFVPLRRSRAWVADSRLILLLDGLDEVPVGSRASCVRAINEFLQSTGVPGIAVCSRRTEYTTLPERLSFTAAVCLQPLTFEQIDRYLENGGSRLATLRQLINHDPSLQELARSPLMLNVIYLAYQDLPIAAIANQSNQDPESRRTHLFECYVKRMFQRLGKAPEAYPQERSKRWLSWLARQMRRHSLTVFLLENLQPSWLASSRQCWRYAVASRVCVALGWVLSLFALLTLAMLPVTFKTTLEGLAFTVLTGITLGTVAGVAAGYRLTRAPGREGKRSYSVFAELLPQACIMGAVLGLTGLTGSFFEPVEQFFLGPWSKALHGWQLGVATGVRNGLFFGLLFCLKTGWLPLDGDVRLSGTLRLSFAAARKGAISGAAAGAIVGVILAMTVVTVQWLQQWQQLVTQFSPLVALLLVLPVLCVVAALVVGLLFGFVAALFSLFSPGDLPPKARPGQGVILSAQSAFLAGVVVATCSGILSAIYWGLARDPDYLHEATVAAVVWGVTAAIWYGGFDIIQYVTLRFLLRRQDHIPRNFAGFLDYAARLIFLQKVGSGYIFVHRQLLDHFSRLQSLEAKPAKEVPETSMLQQSREKSERPPPLQPDLEQDLPPGVEPPHPPPLASAAKTERKAASKPLRRALVVVASAVAVWILAGLILVALLVFGGQRVKFEQDRGDALMLRSRFSEALDSYQKSLVTVKQFSFVNGSWQQDLSVCYEKLGNALKAQNKLPEALDTYLQELAIDKRLTDLGQSNAVWQRNLSVCYQKIGAVLMAQDKLPEALELWKAQKIAKDLAVKDKTNPALQTDLLLLCETVGDVLRSQGKVEEALGLFQQDLEIAQGLAQGDPTNDNWQHNVGVAWERIGCVRQDQNEPAAAAEAFEHELRIFSRLTEQKPQDVRFATGYVVSKLDLAGAYRLLGRQKEALDLIKQARDGIDLQRRAPLSPAQTEMLDKVDKRISMLERAAD